MNFNISLLSNNKAVLEIPWLKRYKFKINWVTGNIEI